ncbi:MAG: hypothetical protein Q4C22_08020, partial [Bacillota bacterium]|nr:hypothetical protein [Bacillota bacterium]
SKEALYLELFQEHVSSRYTGILETVQKSELPPKEKLRYFLVEDVSVARHFGSSSHLFVNLLPHSASSSCSRLSDMVDELICLRVSAVRGILQEGMECGDFSPGDPGLATAAVMGALSFYEVLHCGFFPEEHASRFFCDSHLWDGEEFFRLILNGLAR